MLVYEYLGLIQVYTRKSSTSVNTFLHRLRRMCPFRHPATLCIISFRQVTWSVIFFEYRLLVKTIYVPSHLYYHQCTGVIQRELEE